jgi:hypothetical protein
LVEEPLDASADIAADRVEVVAVGVVEGSSS